MTNKMLKAVKLMIETNLSQRDIAKELDVAEETVSRWKKRDDFKEKLREEQNNFLSELTRPAMRTMLELLDSPSDYVRCQAAQDILDRTGYKPSDRVEIEAETVIIKDDIDEWYIHKLKRYYSAKV